jgi:hypothetical protein
MGRLRQPMAPLMRNGPHFFGAGIRPASRLYCGTISRFRGANKIGSRAAYDAVPVCGHHKIFR